MVPVDERADEESGEQEGLDDRHSPGALLGRDEEVLGGGDSEEDGRRQLDEEVAEGDRRAAAAALPEEREVGEEREVLLPGDGPRARRAERELGAPDPQAAAREPEDADVEEAPHDRAVPAGGRKDERVHAVES